MRRFANSTLPPALAVTAAAFVVYALCAARDVAFGDGPELTAAAVTNGVAHPPGYPLWIGLGHLASLVPAGTLPFRVNLTACAYHACAVGLTYLSAFVLTRRPLGATFAALALAFASPLFASWSMQAEVFSLNDLFASAIVLLCVSWLRDPERWVAVVPALAALFGLGLSNQQSLGLLIPLALWTWYCARKAIPLDRRSLGVAAISLAILLASFFLPYSHTLLASNALTGWHFGSARTLPELRDLILRRAYGGFNLVAHRVDQGGSFVERTWAIVHDDGWPLAAMLAGGSVAWYAASRRQAALALLIVLFPLLAFCAIANVNVHDELLRSVFTRFGLLSLTALAPFAAFLAVDRRAAAVGLALTLVTAFVLLPRLSLANEHGPRALFTDIFAALPRNAILMTAGDPVDQPPVYFQSVEGIRPDVTVVTYGLLDYAPYVDALRARLRTPPEVGMNYPPQVRRDLLVAANAPRPFFVAGERGIHAPGPRYRPSVFGVVSQMLPNGQREDVALHFQRETALESASGYGSVPATRWRTNGFGTTVREYYAGGFFSTGLNAERLGDNRLALAWYEKARGYFADPIIDARISALNP